MVLFNYSTRELTAKIVYYGPGLCGKTTNLQFIHENLPGEVKGKMLSLATKTDRTLFFDFLPIDLGEIRGMKTRVQLYTVPGQVFYNETRKLVLKGADGIVFVADSQDTMLGTNVESFKNLEENLKAHGMRLGDMPHVIQFNKRDLPKLSSIEDLNAALNKFNAPFYESVATTGIGVQDTLKAIVKLVLLHLTKKYDPKAIPAAARAVEAAPAAPVAAARPVAAAVAAAAVPAAEAPRSIPVARASTPEPAAGPAVPLSAFEAEPGPGARVAPVSSLPRGGRSSARPAAEAMPAFADDEIDGLVGEVEEIETPALVAPVAAHPPREATASFEPSPAPPVERTGTGSGGEDDGIWIGTPDEEGSAFASEESTYGFNTSLEDLLAREPDDPSHDAPAARGTAWAPAAAPASEFEIDNGFDPEWAPEPATTPAPPPLAAPVPPPRAAAPRPEPPPPPPPPARAREPEVEPELEPKELPSDVFELPLEEPPAEIPAPKPASEPMGGKGAGAEGDLVLTEVAEDDDLFADPGLEVAHLGAGEAREILVPIVVGDGPSARRFKLAIRLTLDPVD